MVSILFSGNQSELELLGILGNRGLGNNNGKECLYANYRYTYRFLNDIPGIQCQQNICDAKEHISVT